MASTSVSPTVYLVAIDGTPSAAQVLDFACQLTSSLGGAAELHIVHVVDPAPASSVLSMGALAAPDVGIENARRVLDHAIGDAHAKFSGKICAHLATGLPARAIVETASDLRADLIVVGTAGRTGVARALLGSVAETVVRQASCPVLVARPKNWVDDEPAIEPPCPDCVEVQKKNQPDVLWCERHAARHVHGRLHYEVPPSFGVGSMNFRG